MKLPRLCLLPLLALATLTASAAEKSSGPAYANEADRLRAALIAADTERLEATKLGDRARLESILAPDLHYAHSSGKVDDKAALIDSLVSRKSVYESFSYQERKFTQIGVGLATMTGRVLVKVGPPGKPNELDLSFLALWREENGKWRFLAWQSCRIAPPTPPPPH
jgi:hypothetical protein